MDSGSHVPTRRRTCTIPLFGQSLRNERMLSKQNRLLLQASNKPPKVDLDHLPLSTTSRRMLTLCYKLGKAPYYPGNKVRMYIKGREKFADLIDDLRQARHFIHMQYFIFRDDNLGCQIRDELVAATRRGVEVRVLFDDMGSWTVNRRFSATCKKRNRRTPLHARSLSQSIPAHQLP